VLFAVRWRDGALTEVALPHSIDRIEPMGRNAVVVGADQRNLNFMGVTLDDHPVLARQHTILEAAQGELRSHGFFYRSEGSSTGVFGLPIRRASAPGYSHLREGSAAVLFVRDTPNAFVALGQLASLDTPAETDGCKASCVDWYGNARPLFVGDRVFALLGYELVEGTAGPRSVEERRRARFEHP
jgi:hypothetical protein